ncbi:phospholipase A2 inhibitor and Ly6/PLAUR domain-containing protein-like [Mantella aurantiaca]
MKTLLSLTLVASVLVNTGALICQKCVNYHGLTCDSYINETCSPKVNSCFVSIMMEKMGRVTYYQTSRGCATYIGTCRNTYNMTVGTDKELVSTTHCCNGDYCNKEPITFTRKDQKQNGLECPACIEKGKTCEPKTTRCQGTQNHCFEFSGGIYNGTAFEHWTCKGCATENVCVSCTQQYKKPLPVQPDYKLSCSIPKPYKLP